MADEKKDIEQAVAELRKANEALEAGAKNVGELKGKIEKMEAKLDANETENQKLIAQIAESEKKRTEQEEAFKDLEKQIHRMPNGSPAKAEKTGEMRAFAKFMQYGPEKLSAEEAKMLKQSSLPVELKADGIRTDIDPDGGYLAPYEYVQEILKKITLISPIRQLARVRPVSAPGARTFRRDTLVSSYWTGEAKDYTESQSAYGRPEIPLHSLTGLVKITTKDLFGSMFNMEQEVDSDLAEEFNRAESEAFVDGNGASKPEGFINNSDIEVVNSGVADDIAFDNFHDLYGKIKTGYKPVYGSNRLTISRIRKLKNSVGQYIWAAGNVVAGIPNTMNGEPYVEIPHMPDIGAGLTPIVYGDFSKGYLIVDGMTMAVLRNPYKAPGWVYFSAERFVGGAVVLPEALKLLKCHV